MAILVQIYTLTVSGLAFAKSVRNPPILCFHSSILTWRKKLHVKFRSRWAAESALKLRCQFESAA